MLAIGVAQITHVRSARKKNIYQKRVAPILGAFLGKL